MGKFGRAYRIEIDLGDGNDPIVIVPPLTIKFTVVRRFQASLNTFQLSIYNLGKNLRDAIFQDFFDDRTKKKIKFFAGYDNLSLLFEGSIFESYPTREGTDIVVNITSKAGLWDIQNTETYVSLDKGKTVGEVLDFLTSQFTDLDKGAIGDFPEIIERPVVLNGKTYELLKQYSDGRVTIDNEKIYILKEDEAIESGLPVVDKTSGLLGTPRRTEGIIQADMLFEPRLVINEKATLRSEISPVLNGDYKIIGLVHRGTISESVGGTCTTVVDFLVGSQVFKTVAT